MLGNRDTGQRFGAVRHIDISRQPLLSESSFQLLPFVHSKKIRFLNAKRLSAVTDGHTREPRIDDASAIEFDFTLVLQQRQEHIVSDNESFNLHKASLEIPP
jgi:hypothetical protein